MTERASGSTDRRQLRRFGIGGFVVTGAVGAWALWRGRVPLASGALGVAMLLGALGAARPSALALPYRTWRSFAAALGFVNTRILLGVVYLLVVTPISLLLRLLGRDTLDLKWRKDARAAPTFWRPFEEKRPKRERFERPY